jgi:PAS domain S-box-containing protein
MTHQEKPEQCLMEELHQRVAELEKARRENEELHSIYHGMIDGLLVVDLETKQFVRTNAAMCRLLGYSKNELLSMTVMEIHPPEEVPSVLAKFQMQQAGQVLLTENRPILRKDGTVFFADISNTRISYHGRPCVIGFFRDITARKQAEEALHQSEEKYKGLLEACPDAVVMTDLNGQILFASRQTWSMIGLSDSAALVGQSVFNYVVEDDRHRLAENIHRLTETGVRRHTEYTALCQEGATVPTEISSAVNRDAQGKPVAVMAVIRDITERKHVEEALRKKHRTLKYLLQSSDHERQLIAYEIHDELAQQLAGAIMQFEAFHYLKETKPNEAAKAYDAGMTMLHQGHSESRRLIAGVRPPILDESGVLAAISHLVNEQNRLKGQKIEYRSRVVFDRLVPIVENAIYRIVQEGLINACQHGKSEKVRVSLVQREDCLQIEIRDWGIGFNTRAVQGNRFGLEGIRQRTKLLGGKCSIRSRPGSGTRIAVELPVVMME